MELFSVRTQMVPLCLFCDPSRQRDEQTVGFTGLMFNFPSRKLPTDQRGLGRGALGTPACKGRSLLGGWEGAASMAERTTGKWPRSSWGTEEFQESNHLLPAPCSLLGWVTFTSFLDHCRSLLSASLPPPCFPQSVSTQQSERCSYRLSQITAPELWSRTPQQNSSAPKPSVASPFTRSKSWSPFSFLHRPSENYLHFLLFLPPSLPQPLWPPRHSSSSLLRLLPSDFWSNSSQHLECSSHKDLLPPSCYNLSHLLPTPQPCRVPHTTLLLFSVDFPPSCTT